MKKKFIPALLFLLSVLWIIFIFSNSLEDSVESGEKSAWVYKLVRIFIPWVSELFIRKLGHFAEFAILGWLLSASVCSIISPLSKGNSKKLFELFYILPAVFTVACCDELLQNFSEGRYPAFTDVLIDTSGGLFAILSAMGILLLIIRKRKIRNRSSSQLG